MMAKLTAKDLGMVFTFEGEFLHEAAIFDEDTLLKELLTNGENGTVESVDTNGRTALHAAASHGSLKCLKVLLQRGADPNARSGIEDQCSTPVHHAAKNGHLNCLMALLEYEVDLDLKNSNGKRAIDLARDEGTSESVKCVAYIKKLTEQRNKQLEEARCEELYDVITDGQYDKAKSILEKLSNPYAIVNKYYRGPNTLLYRASFGGHLNIIKLLMNYNADGRPNSDSGITPLYAACVHGHLEVAKFLTKRFPKYLIMPATSDETYPLHVAIMKNRLEIVKFLLTMRTPMKNEHAQRKISEDKLIKRSPKFPRSSTMPELKLDVPSTFYVNVNQPTKNGYTPLHLAVMCSTAEMVNELLKTGPVHKHNSKEEPPPGALLIDKSANEKTALHHALILNKVDIVSVLLEHGADISYPLEEGELRLTPLQYVCRNSMAEMLQLLLEYGAEDTNNLARAEAENKGRNRINQMLLNKDVSTDEDNAIALAATEMKLDLKPVYIKWSHKGLVHLEEEWLLNAGLYWNTEAFHKLNNDASLRLKLFTTIDLSHNQLEELPTILFQLPSLKILNLSHNVIKKIPGLSDASKSNDRSSKSFDESDFKMFITENWNCPSLEEIDLQNNQLMTLPKTIFTMPSLISLNCSSNKIANLPFDMWLAPALKTLLLANNMLRSLPIFMTKVVNTNKPEPKYNKKKDSKNTSNNGVKRKDLSSLHIPPDVLDGNSEDEKTIPQIYSKRPSWDGESDDDDDNDEVEFMKKSGLNKLDLANNSFTSVPIGLPCLAPNLAKLNLSKNKITEVYSLSLFPENLVSLDISDNGLRVLDFSGIPNETVNACYGIVKKQLHRRSISNLPTPRKLCLHRKHKQLVNLNRLVLTNNALESLSFNMELMQTGKKPRKINIFPDLKSLHVSNNKLNKVPSGVGNFSKLASLSISDNTSIDSLPSELGLCTELYELCIDRLHIKDPPKNIMENRDIKGILGYLRSLHDKAQVYPNIKLMVVGVHGIGKSTLLEALRREGSGSYQNPEYKSNFNERRANEKVNTKNSTNQSTVGVDICDWSYSKRKTGGGPIVKFSTWDFAGQTEYYATHQCFLSRRALYLVLWKLTDGEMGIDQMEAWLLNIQSRAPNSAVIIVGTFLDKINKRIREQYVEKMKAIIKERFMSIKLGGGVVVLSEKGLPNVVGVIEVSCANYHNINVLRDLIYDTVLSLKGDAKDGNISLLEKPIPASYIQVEQAVTTLAEMMKAEMPVLDESTFRLKVTEILAKENIELRNGNEELDQAVQFLHDYGVILHYDDPSLKDLYFIDPQWLCDMLAHVVTVRNVNPCIKNGVLKISDLRNQIFHGERRFPSSMVMKYVELMSKFEVAIKISDKFLLIPSLLPDQQKLCPIVAGHESEDLRKAMNVHAYLHHRVYRRQYLMTYVPSGFWARLLTRLIADDRICKIVSSCCKINSGCAEPDSNEAREDAEKLIRAAPPEWACWKTGLELSCFGAKLLRVCQLNSNQSFYGAVKGSPHIYVRKANNVSTNKIAIEILTPSLTLEIEKFIQYQKSEEDEESGTNLVGFRVVGVSDESSRAACQIIIITIEHIDNLFAEWYPKIDEYTNIQGVKAVQRISCCNVCLMNEIQKSDDQSNDDGQQSNDLDRNLCGNIAIDINSRERCVYTPDVDDARSHRLSLAGEIESEASFDEPDSNFAEPNGGENDYANLDLNDEELELLYESRENAKGKIVAFELEEASKLLRDSRKLVCPYHLQIKFEEIFPDLCFLDLEDHHLLDSSHVVQGELLGEGAFGKVYKAQCQISGKWRDAAMKIPLNSSKSANQMMATMFSYDTYKCVRQELAILVPVNHVNIIGLLGVIASPFSMLLELAAGGGLDKVYRAYLKQQKKIHPLLIQRSLQQISSALRYLHRHQIIYRDLKCDNVLVCSFPGPKVTNIQTSPVLLKLTDYGISRSVSISGIKGYMGTPGFMAPEIIKYTGKEIYSVAVDCFSFASLMYELISQKQPFSDLPNYKQDVVLRQMANGKRPKLSFKDKRYPVLFLSLMYRCWAQNGEDRPSSAEIHGLTSLPEFSKLLDILGLGESFTLQCVVTTNQTTNHVIDSRSVIGSQLWFCGYLGFGDTVAARKEGHVTVLSYSDNKFVHKADFKLKERVLVSCAVGSTVWLATENGNIKVYCALTYKPVALGRSLYHSYILNMVHSPIFNAVYVTLSEGSVYSYHDKISDRTIYPDTISEDEAKMFFPNIRQGSRITKLRHLIHSTCDFAMHCVAAVHSFAVRKSSKVDNNNVKNHPVGPVPSSVEGNVSTELNYELWCGQEEGRITILDLATLKELQTLSSSGGSNLDDPQLHDTQVNFMEISRTYDDRRVLHDKPDNLNSIWIVTFPGTYVARWNIDTRTMENSFDASQHAPSHDLNSSKMSRKTKQLRVSEAEISSLSVVENRMYVGTSFGCLLICDAYTMEVQLSVRCYEELIDTIIPLRMITSRNREDEDAKKLVLCCGRKCLDHWTRNVGRKKRIAGKEMTILTWLNT